MTACIRCYSVLTRYNVPSLIITKVQPTRDATMLRADLCASLAATSSTEDMDALLADLCTPSEIRTIAERWHVARLLDGTDMSYREIHEATGVSTTTIVRVARFLKNEPHNGYRRALDRLGDRLNTV